MVVAVPVDNESFEEARVVPISDAKGFLLMEVEGGKLLKSGFFSTLGEEFFDYIVVASKNEELEEIFDLGARALLGRKGMYMEEIIEALMFAELDEIH